MRLLKVQGVGHAQAEPDTATLSLDVVGKAQEYSTAMNTLNNATEQLKARLRSSKLPIVELKTTDFSINTETKYENGQSIDIGYRASHRMNIVMANDKALLNDVIDQVVHSQSDAQFQVSFTLKDNEALRQKALQNAVLSAQNNAHTLATTAQLQLGKVQEILYGDDNSDSFRSFGGAYESATMMSAAKADIDPQDVEIQAQVSMVFELLD